MTPYAYRTSHAALEPLVMALLGTNRDTGFDIKKLAAINEIFEKEILPKYKHLLDDSKVSIIDINVLLHQTPGGMLSNLVNQLREMDALDKIDEVYRELPRVRKDLGQIPLVTPTSQIVGVQTVNNVLHDTPDERYKMITGQVKDLCYGLYGKTAVPINPEVQKKALKGYPRGEEPITCRPAEVLEPELEKAKEEIGDLAVDLDDLILYAQFPVTGKKFLEWKYGKSEAPDSVKPITLEDVKKRDELIKKALAGELIEKKGDTPEKSEAVRTFNVFVDNEYFNVEVDPTGEFQVVAAPHVAPASASVAAAPAAAPSAAPAPAPAAQAQEPAVSEADGTLLLAPMPGMIVKYVAEEGQTVKKGDTVVILEAMKMENALTSPADGVVKGVKFGSGDSVAKGAVLCVIA
jgi:oxaloacetate decarboxylase alpha subunit/pyruvate carboxylase subunit B